MSAMTGAYLPLVVGVAAVLAAVAAVVATARARRAEAAVHASEEAYRQLTDRHTAPGAAGMARDEKLRHAQIMDAIGRKAGDVAHDFNDLLAAITGRAELLIATLHEGHPGMQEARDIRTAVLGAARITKPLRELMGSRAATEVIDVNAVTSHTADALREMLGSGIEVSVELDPRGMHVRAGASHVEELVLNLAMNARASMPNGGHLTLSTTGHTRREPDPNLGPAGQFVRLIVADTGAGMSEAERQVLFEPLLVAPGAGSRAIALAKVCDIVRQAGGQIHVDSAPGLGTTFTVDLPAITVAPVAASSAPSYVNAIVASVLVVEDEPVVRELIRLVLARGGHDVVAVAGPHAAITALKRQPLTELMLIDVVMPDMNGYDLAIQARLLAPGMRIVFMSGFARDEARHPPNDGFLHKPFKTESLNEVVQEALRAS